jgi:hypothetical protein
MGPVFANHHCTERLGQFIQSLACDRHRRTAFLRTLGAENPDHEISAADPFDLF